MGLRGRQTRFLLGTFLCWTAARALWLWPGSTAAIAPSAAATVDGAPPRVLPIASIVISPGAVAPTTQKSARFVPHEIALETVANPSDDGPSPAYDQTRLAVAVDEHPPTTPSPAPLFPPLTRSRHRWEAQAYLFWRPGSGTASLAGHGELGGSQFAIRIAASIGHRLAVAGRLYAPLEHRGAEAALGLDWHPLPGRAIRVSVERRQRLDPLGRSAWSAYVAGGFWRGGGAGKPVFDGYAQAGVVGTQRRDLFIDGALRLGYQLPVQGVSLTAGAGLWGAAQPQVSRIDIGPRVAMVVPVDRHALTLALDGRFRMAGHAAPSSGASLTIAADF